MNLNIFTVIHRKSIHDLTIKLLSWVIFIKENTNGYKYAKQLERSVRSDYLELLAVVKTNIGFLKSSGWLEIDF
jgi:hypothetical protein